MGLRNFLFPPADKDRFAKLIIRELQRNGETSPIAYDAAQFKLTIKDQRNNVFYLKDFRQIGPRLYVSPWQDNHDASRLFLHGLIWQLKVKGDHVAMAPNRDFLVVTGSDDADGPHLSRFPAGCI